MKPITKIDDLVSGSVYWVRLKDNDRAAIESVVCAINRSRHYFVFSNDIDVNKDINHHDAHTVLNNHIVVGPVPTPTIWEFMKHTVEMKADPNQGLCQEISLPGGQQCCALSSSPFTVNPILQLDPKYTTGRVVKETPGEGVEIDTVPVVPYFLSEEEQAPDNIDLILLCLFRHDARMIAASFEGKKTVILSRPFAAEHKYHIHVVKENQIDADSQVDTVLRNLRIRKPEARAHDWADASELFKSLIRQRDVSNESDKQNL